MRLIEILSTIVFFEYAFLLIKINMVEAFKRIF